MRFAKAVVPLELALLPKSLLDSLKVDPCALKFNSPVPSVSGAITVPLKINAQTRIASRCISIVIGAASMCCTEKLANRSL